MSQQAWNKFNFCKGQIAITRNLSTEKIKDKVHRYCKTGAEGNHNLQFRYYFETCFYFLLIAGTDGLTGGWDCLHQLSCVSEHKYC